jgi:hypothetical protein
MNFTNYDPFLRHIYNVEKAIREAVLKILLSKKVLLSENDF